MTASDSPYVCLCVCVSGCGCGCGCVGVFVGVDQNTDHDVLNVGLSVCFFSSKVGHNIQH